MAVRSVAIILLLCGSFTAAADESENITFEDLFHQAAIRHIALSPNGEFFAYFRDNTLVMGTSGDDISDIREFNSRLDIVDLDWIGPNTVWVESRDPRRESRYLTAISFKQGADGGYALDEVEDHTEPGFVNDPLPDDDDHVVFASPRVDDDVISTELYRVNVFEPLEDQLTRANRIDTGSEDFFYYKKDAAGEYTLGIRIAEGVPELWRRLPDGASWERIWSADSEFVFIPRQMSDDGKTLWVLTDALTERVAAVEFDIESRKFGKILYVHDRVDLDAILISKRTHQPTGVIFTEQGLMHYHFFSDEKSAEFDRLSAHFPGEGVMVIGSSQDASVRLVYVSSPSERGTIHVCDIVHDQCKAVGPVAPWMKGKSLSDTVALDIPSTDGFVVEAFLTLPASGGEHIPLVALPHGGPIGISDDRYFSPEVQWLAANGYAVLQVNYRGSGGYGQGFEAAGLRQWGRGIEDDIEAAVYKALDEYPQLDPSRVGIFGGSYGGYSAIMSVIRNPKLFRCAASWAGVMDLTLLFTQTSESQNEYLRKTLISYVGDPDIDYDEQRENSPVYRYREIERPILLGHGMEDTVVDVEHSWRLRKLLAMRGTGPEFILLDGVGHGFDYIKDARQFYEPLVAFLDKHLKQDEKVAAH